MVELEDGMTMICVTHEMGFDVKWLTVLFMDEGQIIEQNEPEAFFNAPKSDRTKLFLSRFWAIDTSRRSQILVLNHSWSGIYS